MENFTNTINQFVNKMRYLNNKNVEGIIHYGSSQTGFANEFSDIDLHIIFNDNLSQEIRGAYFLYQHRIEYFEKKLQSMYQKANYEYEHQSNVLVSMIVYGNVFLDRNGKIALLKDYIQRLYSNPLPKLDLESTKEQIAIINNFFDDLKFLVESNNIYATHVFHLTLERIKDLYFSINALPGVSRTKALKVMLDDNYRNAIKKENPSQEFIDLYLICLNETKSIWDRLPFLIKLFQYTIRNINFDKNNHRILLKTN